jgi:hypothetical protein
MFSWVSSIMPYLEEASLHDTVDWTIPLGVRNAQTPPDTAHHIPFETYLCPSDERVGITNTWYGARGNYAGNVGIGLIYMNDPSPTQDCFGGTTDQYGCDKSAKWPPSTANPKHPKSSLKRFGAFMMNKGRRMSEFEDGTSKTAAISEVRNIPGQDTRGVLHFGAGVLYMHDYPPNYVELPDRTRWCPADAPSYAPCLGVASNDYRGGWRHWARSAHSGGVNVMMVDTNGRFVSDGIDPLLWIAIGSAEGEEVISDDF